MNPAEAEQRAGAAPRPLLRVGEFATANTDRLTPLPGVAAAALARVISRRRLQKLGMALVGFADSIQDGRVYVFGNTERRYLAALAQAEREAALARLDDRPVCCLLLTHGQGAPPVLASWAARRGIPLLGTPLDSSTAIYLFTDYLGQALAPVLTLHGSLLDVFGTGVLLTGDSGVGKSECALELVLKGHRLVADDAVEIRNVNGRQLVGRAPEALRDLLELRGIGIVNLRELFGISVVGRSAEIGLILELERWDPGKDYERLGLEIKTRRLWDQSLPFMTIPVAPGRNLATLVELACRVHRMRSRGLAVGGAGLEHLTAPLEAETDDDGGAP